jgi:hypothetical protein
VKSASESATGDLPTLRFFRFLHTTHLHTAIRAQLSHNTERAAEADPGAFLPAAAAAPRRSNCVTRQPLCTCTPIPTDPRTRAHPNVHMRAR